MSSWEIFYLPIISFYSDDGREFLKLKYFLHIHGINHFLRTPHTPQQNRYAEICHRHICETGLTLLSQASLSHKFWTYAFYTTSYLINRWITPTLGNKSPFEILFQGSPNYTNLKNFGCLCYPWLKPYTRSKLDSQSRPWINLGPLYFQSGYACFDLIHNKIYHSRHVEFVENIFPSKNPSSFKPSLSHTLWRLHL